MRVAEAELLDGSWSVRLAVGSRARSLAVPALLGLLGLASALPLWSSRLLPFQDAPQHLAAVRAIADYHANGLGFDRWFVLDFQRLEYLGFYLPAAALAKLVGPQAACRALLTLVALLLPLTLAMLLSALGRDLRLAVFAPALFHTAPLYLGFFNFVAAVPVLFAGVALAERELREPRAGRAWALGALAVASLWLHPSALALLLCAAGFLAATSGERPARAARALLPLVPSALLLSAWLLRDLLATGQATQGGGLVLYPLREHVLDVLRFGNVLAGHADEAFAAALALLFVAAALVPGKPAPGPRPWRLKLLAAGVLLAVLAAPFGLGSAGFIYLRAVPLLLGLAICLPRLSPRPLATSLLAAAAALQLSYSVVLTQDFRAFDREAQAPELARVLHAALPGRRLLALVARTESAVVQFHPLLHAGQLYAVERGGRARVSFAEFPWTPVRFRPGTAAPLPRGFEHHPEWFDAARDGADEDYLLVRAAGPPPAALRGFTLLARDGFWSLYERARD